MPRVSGSQVGKVAKKTIACTKCNFAIAVDVMKVQGLAYKTGSPCPVCQKVSPLPPAGEGSLRLFDSRAESQRSRELLMLERAGVIYDLGYQVKFELRTQDFETGNPIKVCNYYADFSYFQKGKDGLDDWVVEDVKGNVMTDVAALKMKWFEKQYGLPVTIIQR